VTTVAALIRFAHLSSAAFLLGSLAFHAIVARPSLRAAGAQGAAAGAAFGRRQRAIIKWTLLSVFLTGLVGFGLQIAAVTGMPLSQALRPENIGGVLLGTRYGMVWLVRMGLIVILAWMLARQHEISSVYLRPVALILAAALILAPAFSSHAAAGEGIWLFAQLASDALHLLAASAWLGGLPALAIFLAWNLRLNHAWATVVLKESTRRFSLLGGVCVTVVLATGLFNAWTLVGAVPPLLGTAYGKLLLVKLVWLVPLLAVAAINLRKLKPGILVLEERSSMPRSGELLRRLKRNVRTEAGIGACILLIVGFMGVTPPARHIQPDWPLDFRWNWNALESSAKVRSQMAEAKWLGAAGLVGIVGYFILRRRFRYLVLGIGVASLGYGGWLGHNALSIDAYPSTYLRPAVPYNAISVANGLRLYHDACAGCHGVGGYGDGVSGEDLKPKPADLTAKHSADHTAGDLFWWLSHGIKKNGLPGPMPSFVASLDEEERWDMINFLRALSAAERGRQMSALVDPEPSLVAPDFVYRTVAEESRSLKDHRGNDIVMLVLFSLPESRARLAELEGAARQLQSKNVKVLAIPKEIKEGLQLNRAFKSLSLVIDGSREAFDTYALLRRSFSEQGTLPDPPIPPHMEFIIDRQGYVRARWIPRDGPGWDKLEHLLREIDRLNQEKPAAPAPDDHVH
jgi:putative copper resistance protein D